MPGIMAVVDQKEGNVGDETQAMEATAHGDFCAKRRGVAPQAAPSQSVMEHAWAPEEDASLPKEDTVELLAMLEEDEIDDEVEEVQASPPQMRQQPQPRLRSTETMCQS